MTMGTLRDSVLMSRSGRLRARTTRPSTWPATEKANVRPVPRVAAMSTAAPAAVAARSAPRITWSMYSGDSSSASPEAARSGKSRPTIPVFRMARPRAGPLGTQPSSEAASRTFWRVACE